MTAAVLALLIATPERVVVVAKKAEPPGFLARMGKSLRGIVRGLYERDDDDVAVGNALLAQGDPEGALREYDKARARLPDDPGVAFDRAAALLKLDPSKAGAAAGEAGRAEGACSPSLRMPGGPGGAPPRNKAALGCHGARTALNLALRTAECQGRWGHARPSLPHPAGGR